jgi:tetraacyldisaccharide 4'-kinase
MAFSGIATPERFEATLRDVGVNLVANRRFLDHHAFAEEDLDEILERALRAKAEYIVTTEKDAVRLQTEFHPSIPLLYIRLDVDVMGGNEGFNSAIERICLGSAR